MVPARLRARRGREGEQGFALVLVIWGLGLIGLIAGVVMTAERYRILAAANMIENAKAEALAEAAVAIGRLVLASAAGGNDPPARLTTDGVPLLCTMADGAMAALAIEDEGGKVDLNTASPKLVAALLRGFGADADEVDRLAASIVEFARPSTNAVLDDAAFQAYAADGRPWGPKKGPFETVLELDQVIGMRADLLHAVMPYVTVYSRKPGVDPRVAAPALLAALSGAEPAAVAVLASSDRARDQEIRGIAVEFLAPSTRSSFLIRAEIRMPSGGIFVREAIAELTTGSPLLALREWRRGRSRFDTLLEAAQQQPSGASSRPTC